MTLAQEQERHLQNVKQALRGSQPYDSGAMQKDWEAAVACAILGNETLVGYYMTRIRAGLELGIEFQKMSPSEERGPVELC